MKHLCVILLTNFCEIPCKAILYLGYKLKFYPFSHIFLLICLQCSIEYDHKNLLNDGELH
jgi:hypothetical protein